MKKITLTVACYLVLLKAYSQCDSSKFKSRKLKVEEINFVTSYYSQDGNNSAVTGGIGTEKLTDIANALEVKLVKGDSTNKTKTLSVEVGIDSYTSASSDKIDPTTISSASMSDTRIYPSATYTIKNEKTHNQIGLGVSYSREFDYTSIGTLLNLSKSSKDNNSEFGIRLQAFFDTWKIILPVEFRGNAAMGLLPTDTRRNSFNSSLSYSRVVNTRLQFALLIDPSYQQGLLGTPYQRVYFNDGSERVEHLPDTRIKFPVGLRASYFAGDIFIIRSFYRYYQDSWGLMANTISLEAVCKITPFVSVSPFYRFYSQSAVDYFAPYGNHKLNDAYYTSDYDLSELTSHLAGITFRLVSDAGILGIRKFNALELRYGHYIRNTGLQSDEFTLAVKFR